MLEVMPEDDFAFGTREELANGSPRRHSVGQRG